MHCLSSIASDLVQDVSTNVNFASSLLRISSALSGKPRIPAEHEDWNDEVWEDAKGLNAPAVQQLSCCNSPHLKHLTIHLISHDVKACYYISGNTWSRLETVSLSGVFLDEQSATALAACDWPGLKELVLNAWSVHAKAVSILAQITWPHFKSLVFCSTLVHETIMASLVEIQHTVLEKLVLADCSVSAEGLAVLVKARWPLKELELSGHSYWNADGFAREYQELGKANWPNLRKLEASGVLAFDATCASYLTSASLP